MLNLKYAIITAILFVFGGLLLLFSNLPAYAQPAPLSGNPDTSNHATALNNLANAALGSALDVDVVDDWAYVTDGCGGLDIVNVSNPLTPVVYGHLETPMCMYTVKVAKHYAYAACISDECDLQIIDVSNPISPSLRTQYGNHGEVSDIAIEGNRAYVARLEGFDILELTNPISPTLLGSYTITQGICIGNGFNIVVKDNFAYLTTRADVGLIVDLCGSLQIIDVSSPTTPTLVATFKTGSAYGVQVVDKRAYLTYRNPGMGLPTSPHTGGIQVIDVSTPVSPTLIGQYRSLASPYTIQVTDTLAYIANGDAGMAIIDISNPVSPTLRASYPTTGYVHTAQVIDNFIYAATDLGGLEIISTSDALAYRVFLPLVR